MPHRATEITFNLPYDSMHPDPKKRTRVPDTGRRLDIQDGRLVGVEADGSPVPERVPEIDHTEHVPSRINGGELHTPKGVLEERLESRPPVPPRRCSVCGEMVFHWPAD